MAPPDLKATTANSTEHNNKVKNATLLEKRRRLLGSLIAATVKKAPNTRGPINQICMLKLDAALGSMNE
jgi:hypothetical protein